ncbi:Coiled-coil domain-containing protein 40 [Globomyces sp. JEL0801]|nr:Coiled-coil domain-containing protein 40 [Globomyces sp. JEL0801]
MNSDIEQDNEVAANSSVVASGSESQPDTTSSNQDKVSIIGSNPSENQISNKINPTGIDEPPIESLPELPKVVQQREDLEHYSLVNPLEDESEKEAINIRPIIADDVADESMKAELHKVVLIDETLETSENGRKEPTRQAREKEITDNVEEDVDDEIDENIMMDPDHPLLQRVQEAIYEQLSAHEQKLLLEIREREEEANKEKKRREDAGVQLYTVQQQLARLQALFEGSEENYEIIKGLREDAERMLKHTKSDYQKEQEKLKNHTRNLEQHQTELEKLSRSLKQVDLYEEELRSKILVAKRTTLKAEKDIIKQELEKKRQDFFIDHLTEQLRRLQERKMTYDSQLLVQQRETQAATATLHDAATEMEAIQFEKRQLVNQWKSSLIGLKKRTEMLQEIELAITKNNESLRVMNSEIDGFKRTLRKVQEEGENLTSLHNKLESETEYIKRQITSIGEQRDKLSDSYSVYMKSLTQIEQELQERISVQLEINSVQKATIASTTATQKLEGEIAEKLKLQSSFQKGAQTSQKDGSKLRLLIHEKESAAAAFQNELSVIRLETLNVEASIRNMKEQLKVVDGTIVEKNKLIGKYETEIRQNNDQLSKKASEMDSLNKKYDQMTSGNQDAHMGPLEATIYNISKSIKLKETECLQLQQYWLKAQNEMVTISKDGVELTDLIQSLRMRLTVLNRKKMVVNNAFETEEKQIKEHHRNIRQLQNEMIKVNTLLNKQSNLYGRLEESNLEMEMKFRNKLKDAELDSIHMENQLEKLKAEKEEALVGLIESE